MEQKLEEKILAALEFEWCEEGGLLFECRCARFNVAAYIRTRDLIASIDFSGQEQVSKRLVRRMYDIPAYLLGHRHHVLKRGGNALLYDQAISELNRMVAEKFELR